MKKRSIFKIVEDLEKNLRAAELELKRYNHPLPIGYVQKKIKDLKRYLKKLSKEELKKSNSPRDLIREIVGEPINFFQSNSKRGYSIIKAWGLRSSFEERTKLQARFQRAGFKNVIVTPVYNSPHLGESVKVAYQKS